jgi:hypothetical protein
MEEAIEEILNNKAIVSAILNHQARLRASNNYYHRNKQLCSEKAAAKWRALHPNPRPRGRPAKV